MEVRPSSVRSNDLSSCRRGSDPIDRNEKGPRQGPGAREQRKRYTDFE